MNKIEFFVMALVGLYLCSCGNKQIGKEELCGIRIQPVPGSHIVQGVKLTPDSLILRSSLVFRLALKLLDINDEPLMGAFADKSALIERLHGEADLSAVYLYDLGFGPYLHSNGGCGAVTYVDMRAYGTLSFFETGLDGEDRSLLDKGYHHRCGEHLHLATANVRSNIRRCHGRLLTTLDSQFYHNQQILFVSLFYEIN